jgi:hypothetical protein
MVLHLCCLLPFAAQGDLKSAADLASLPLGQQNNEKHCLTFTSEFKMETFPDIKNLWRTHCNVTAISVIINITDAVWFMFLPGYSASRLCCQQNAAGPSTALIKGVAKAAWSSFDQEFLMQLTIMVTTDLKWQNYG